MVKFFEPGFKILDSLAEHLCFFVQICVLRFKLRTALRRCNQLISEQRDLIAANRSRTMLIDELLKKTERIERFHVHDRESVVSQNEVIIVGWCGGDAAISRSSGVIAGWTFGSLGD
ncbi:hypothetical protein Poly21_04020 [Allorhodopirellula heiligendammensis]|uniref:Uncharacterized protein n=1 Tax=Allorhodopirellula heiligendammensis TaxID=2714739 RepID=A0A5C6C2L2_9BACT|nr:hypothetical protein Poly21_04020 [Allorhodopirellula heiligendammensis]